MKSRFLVVALISVCATHTLLAQTQQVKFYFVGHAQTWVVPNSVTSVTVDARGAQGGGNPDWASYAGGKGGRVQTTLAVTPGETLVIYVGGRGGDLTGPNTAGPGGFNGGGAGNTDNIDFNGPSAGGGGASDVRQGGDDLAHRVVVAGGGGGAECCGDGNGGDGGGTTGMAGATLGDSAPGGGGTQAYGGAGGGGCNGSGTSGSLGQGGVGGNGNRAGGGGGGGYYGGGGGGGCDYGSGGGGGSSFSAGTDTIHSQGYQTGDGQIIITASACQVSYTGFHQYASPPTLPETTRTAKTSYPPTATSPVPQYFGFLPQPNPFPGEGLFVLCPTKATGCALTATATMLTSFSSLPPFTATSLDAGLIQVLGYDTGDSRLCPLGKNKCEDSELTTYNDWCELGPASVEAVAPNVLRLVDGQDQGVAGSIDQFLDEHVCTNGDRVILKLDEFQNGSSESSGSHFVFVTGKSPTPGPNGGTDWNVFDPGWNPASTSPPGSLSSLQGHTVTGFEPSDGIFRKFTVIGVRPYEDISSGVNSGSLSFTANSPIELLVVDPLGQRLGDLNGVDTFEIPKASYIRDFPLADDSDVGTANGDPTGIKTAHVPFPLKGTYQVTATGTELGVYTLRVRTLATDGSVQASNFVGVTNTGSTLTYELPYSPAPGSSGPVTLVATFQGTLADISNSLALGLIDNQGIANALSSKTNAASAAAAGGDNKTARNILNAFINQLNAQTGKHVNGIAPQVLMGDANSLLAQIR